MSVLSVAVVGLRGIGVGHARGFAALPGDFRLVAGCDLDETRTRAFAGEFPGTSAYPDYAGMLARARPDVVVIATNTVSHAGLAIGAAGAGVRGILLEKPMAVGLADARAVVAACRSAGCALIVNHQRRTYPVFAAMRRLVEEGAVGKLLLVRGCCAGDILSDGTHTVDTIRHLAGDAEVKWVMGQVHRDPPPSGEPRGMGYDASGGWRYGHPIESGAMASFEFSTGVRAEVFTGTMCVPGHRGYQDFEAIGEDGRLWRAGDGAKIPLQVQDRGAGGWRPVEVPGPADPVPTSSTLANYREFARMIREGGGHPLSGDSALRDHEIIMAIHESSRLRARVDLPLGQERYPLELVLEEAQAGGPARKADGVIQPE
ncbi:MAG: Gfo/Idh/MocA family oxidoreductase [Candidatus Coatesbacteria bacterium]